MQSLLEFKGSTLKDKLLQILGNEANALKCIKHIMSDRVDFKGNNTYNFVQSLVVGYKNSYGQQIDLTKANLAQLEDLAKSDPLAFLISIIIYEYDKSDVDTTALREMSATHFQSCFDEKRFGRQFFYSRALLPVLTDLLIVSGLWKPAGNDSVEDTINEQVMGVYSGTVSYSKGQKVPKDIVKKIEGKIETKVGPLEPPVIDEKRVATKWFFTSELDDGIENRLNRFYIPSRRKVQKEIVNRYQAALIDTSNALGSILKEDKQVLLIIGPYGAGKSTYLSQYGLDEKKFVSYNVDALKNFFASATTLPSNNSDYHFEAAILYKTVDIEKVKSLFASGAFIDESRFARATRIYSRKKVQIIEVATPNVADAVIQYCERENTTNYDFALTSSIDARNFLGGRINNLEKDPNLYNIDYKLVCNTHEGFKDVLTISTQDGKRQKVVLNSDLLAKIQEVVDKETVRKDIESRLEQKVSCKI